MQTSWFDVTGSLAFSTLLHVDVVYIAARLARSPRLTKKRLFQNQDFRQPAHAFCSLVAYHTPSCNLPLPPLFNKPIHPPTHPPARYPNLSWKGRRLIEEWLLASGDSPRLCIERLRRLASARASWGWPKEAFLARDVADALLTGAIKVR